MKIERIDNVLEGTGVTQKPSTGEGIIRGLKDALANRGARRYFYVRPKGDWGHGDGKTYADAFDGLQDRVTRVYIGPNLTAVNVDIPSTGWIELLPGYTLEMTKTTPEKWDWAIIPPAR